MAAKTIRFPNSGHNGPSVEPNYNSTYLHIFEFEKYDHTVWHDWMYRNWAVSVYASGLYVTLIFLGQLWMRNRKPLKDRKALLIWNVFLALFSAVGFFRSVPELLYEVMVSDVGGLKRSVCFV